MSKAALINYYNTAANDAKSKAKSITKTQNQASLAKAPQINNGILESIANTLMKAFLSDSPKSVNETYSSAAEKKENFYVGGQSYSSKLTASDVTSATCKKSGSNYVVTLKVKGSSVSKAFSTISKNQITDAVKGMVKFNSIDISYSDSTIQATVGPNGKLQKVYYDMPAVTMNFDVNWEVGSKHPLQSTWEIGLRSTGKNDKQIEGSATRRCKICKTPYFYIE